MIPGKIEFKHKKASDIHGGIATNRCHLGGL